jgi:Transposase DDE domain
MLDLHIIEPHPQRVLEAFRRGEFDQIEIIGEADEKEFFELCFQEKMLEALAKEMPTARKKKDVPLWFLLAANLSLKLHLENSFLAFERVIRCGGLLSALPPEIASKHLDPQSQQILLECRGFNDKNEYPRATPCDQDTVRKSVKHVPAQQWMDWFNGQVQEIFQAYGFFDPAGIFVGDGSYLFVPDNPAYEGSVVMWFDEHNHPVEYEKLNAQERKKARRERCYKLVSLLHLRGDCYVYAALAVVPGNAHECPVLYQLVEQFVKRVGKGVIKLLILDRGLVDGKNITRCKTEWGLDVLLPMKRKMDLWEDAWALAKQCPWQEWTAPQPEPRIVPSHRPEVIVRRELKRQKTLAANQAKEPPPDPAKVLVRTEICPIKGFSSWTECGVPIHVLLVRETYADGHRDEWGLMTTADFTDPHQPKDQYGLRTKIEERHRVLKCFHDLSDFRSRCLNVIVAQVVFILLSYTLRQWQLWKLRQEELAAKTPGLLRRQLNIHNHFVVIYHQNAYTQMPLVTFSRELLEMPPEARAKALTKVRQLEQSFLTPLQNLRAPP